MDKGTTNAIQGQIPQVVRSLDELAREGARRMIAEALELEVEEYIERLRHPCVMRTVTHSSSETEKQSRARSAWERAQSNLRLRASTTDGQITDSRARSFLRI
jgi:hypothetical protein